MQKESYFTPDTIHTKTQELLTLVREFQRRHNNIVFSPDRAALLVLDMQNYFLQESSHAFIPSAPAILPNIQALVNVFATHKHPIVFTRHANTKENAGMMAVWWKDLIRIGSAESKIIAALDASKGAVLSKKQYDAFYSTSLEDMLRAERISQVVVTGVMTNLCCETTARSAFGRGFEVFFPIDGTATYSEAFHRATLLNLAHGFAVPVSAEIILAAYED